MGFNSGFKGLNNHSTQTALFFTSMGIGASFNKNLNIKNRKYSTDRSTSKYVLRKTFRRMLSCHEGLIDVICCNVKESEDGRGR